MICDHCHTTILESSRAWDFHHSDIKLFERSFLKGCIFCTRLLKHMESKQFLRIDQNKATQDTNATAIGSIKGGRQEQEIHWQCKSAPFFRWTVRKLVKTRDVPDCICLIFRPLPGFDGMNAPDASSTREHAQLDLTASDKDTQIAPKSLPDVAFYFYPDQGPWADPCPNPHELGGRTDSEKTWAQIKTWVKKCCDEHHESCHIDSFVPEGIRILDIGPDASEWPPTVRVIERDSGLEGNGRYITLSHCWGSKLFVQLTEDTYDLFTGPGIPWQLIEMNKNFVGAIQVARRLGIRYVWIDSLCIKQSHPDDWEQQAGKMKDVYRRSYCNISASSSPDRDGGLFHDREPDQVAITRHTGTSGLFQGRKWRIVAGDLWKTSLLGEALYTRAWVFQERLLAPRLLHFTYDQVFWECATTSACEALPAGLPARVDSAARYDRDWRRRLQTVGKGVADSGELVEFWERALHFFTGCSITKQSDKLKAIQGIADLVAETQGRDPSEWYENQGLWVQDLVWELPWTVSEGQSASRPTHDMQLLGQNLTREERELSFPSWSWASIGDAAVDMSTCLPVEGGEDDKLFLAAPEICWPKSSHVSTTPLKARLVVLCPVSRGWVQSDDGYLTLGVGKSATVQTFPDSQNIMSLESEHEFLILSVNKSPKQYEYGNEPYGVPGRHIPEREYLYSGFGLLVNKNAESPLTYERTGVVKFALDTESWKDMWGGYGSDPDKSVLDHLPLTRVEVI